MNRTLVVTFTCNNNIHVYDDKSGVKPMPPYKTHSSVEDARIYLEETRGVTVIKVLNK
jgi:hypothetical protein